ncbi:DUF4333 domain-containing protein [Ornithinimicrobium ciconiae]|uniref:DUF4333 domain-containing protein n=1 Tax=Ornithinimicrobium ciconiae TaxID=2594265 RepID=A0A516GFL6_9MICO|nr:DUF4333 domain-containing protein [Ornithinimicrobium ciconiae]QDO90130.1 DUF4333 domain-containing protein [Ornithinimicrobium ciconiae]
MGSWSGRRAAGLLAVVLTLAACSRGEVPAGDLQQSVRDGLATEGVELRSVTCPSGVASQLGASVVCQVEFWEENALGEPVDRVRIVVTSVEGDQVRYRLEPLAVGVADDAEAPSPAP